MNLIDALRTGKPLRRPIPKFLGNGRDGWVDSLFIKDQLLNPDFNHFEISLKKRFITDVDFFADDWEVKE